MQNLNILSSSLIRKQVGMDVHGSRERPLKKARHSQKVNTALRVGKWNSDAQNDGLCNEAVTVKCQSFIVVLPLVDFD
jgi:hypothetical protein